ncbi:MAG: sulfatase-like hydrolase/transferase [Candidatus Omnitrophica bacterium]|nr:sulfatase-like hydrolase/transferase [Candidatus Omnitrophota bacterium]
MADDLGWGDTGFNGHPVIKTPHLDRMAQDGICFKRFYAAAPVCSPTRASCLTGRHPIRMEIYGANSGHIKDEEINLAEVLKSRGYRTGHFGKWHLGTLTTKVHDSNRGEPGNTEHYAPPWDHGFDACFSTEAKVPTWDPMITPEHGNWKTKPGEPFGTHYWTGPEQKAAENLKGDDSRIIMDRAIAFIRDSAKQKKPFFTVIWFHAPHSPVLAGEKYRTLYHDVDENKQHYYGCISALDEQIGRLRNELNDLNVAENTMIWFCSDNGPAGKGGGVHQEAGARQQGSTGSYRGRKGSLYEGGVRVPSLLVWPSRIKQKRTTDIPCVTSDYYPTILDILGIEMNNQPAPIDGISLKLLIDKTMKKRPRPIAFEFNNQMSLVDNRYKIYSNDGGKSFELYDLIEDPSESTNLRDEKPEQVKKMTKQIDVWRDSCRKSKNGEDYNN